MFRRQSKIRCCLIDDETKAFLCSDGKFRRLPTFGTYPECVKFYKLKGFAERKQREIVAYTSFKPIVYILRNGDEVRSDGTIVRAG